MMMLIIDDDRLLLCYPMLKQYAMESGCNENKIGCNETRTLLLLHKQRKAANFM